MRLRNALKPLRRFECSISTQIQPESNLGDNEQSGSKQPIEGKDTQKIKKPKKSFNSINTLEQLAQPDQLNRPALLNLMESDKPLSYSTFPLNYMNSPLKDIPIPCLCNGLEYVVKTRGLITRDTLGSIVKQDVSDFYKDLPQPEEIDSEIIGEYKPPSKDELLLSIGKKHKSQYLLATSTSIPIMSHIDYFITGFRSPLFNRLSYEYTNEPLRYIISLRKPTTSFATVVSSEPLMIAIDSDEGFLEASNLIFLKMGGYIEHMITQNQQDFNRKFLLKNKPYRLPTDKARPEYHSFLKAGKMVLRSQIDAGIMDNKIIKKIEVKTRAITPQRYDAINYDQYFDYKLFKDIGLYESYEREYYDLIRGSFNKYLHQMTIGGMAGVIVAYHNTKEVFGFEYFDRWHLEKRVYGSQEFAGVCFRAELALMQEVFDYIFGHEDLKKVGEVVKIGCFASYFENCLIIMVERIDDVANYKQKLKGSIINPKFNDIMDYYERSKIKPNVSKYTVTVNRKLNGVNMPNNMSIFYEPKDHLEYSYNIYRKGKVDYKEYMQFLHEAYKGMYKNVENEYSGSWR